jgi:NitT/TauT family transport system substrate-binding protein
MPIVKANAADPVRLGMLHTLSPAPFYIAQERGYFRDEGLEVTFRFFEAAQPIAAAAVSNDIDVGVTALTGGFFNLAEKGILKVIGGGLHEEKGYEGSAILVSNQAFDAGLTSVEKLGGHSFAITQYGSSFDYMIGRIAEVRGFDLKTIQLRVVQQISNMIAAVSTGQVDATIAIASQAKPLAAKGQAHIIGWVGEIVPYQITALFTTGRMIQQNEAVLHRFAKAYQRGVTDYREAFLRRDAAGNPVTDAKTDAAIANITVYVFTGDAQAREKILNGVGYYDANGALDVADIKEQLRAFKARDLVKGDADPDTLIDTRFLPVR